MNTSTRNWIYLVLGAIIFIAGFVYNSPIAMGIFIIVIVWQVAKMFYEK